MRRHVFISHSEKDNGFAQMLLIALEQRGARCWIAPRDIPPGGSYADAIMRAIEECSCFVLAYTIRSNTSAHVLREVERALKFEKNIVPVRFDQSEPSRSLDYLLATVHWLSVDTPSSRDSIARIAEQIAACLPTETLAYAGTPLVEEPRQSLSKSDRSGGRKRALIVIVIFVPLIVTATLLITRSLSGNKPLHYVGDAISSPTIHPELEPAATPVPSMPAQEASPVQKLAAPSSALVQHPTPQAFVEEPPESPSPVPPKQPAESNSANQPQDTLRKYFTCFREHDPTAAYNLLSRRFQSSLSFKKYSEVFSSTHDIRLLEANTLSQTQNSARIFVSFEETDANSRQAAWQGPIDLVEDPDGWRIDTMKDLKRVPVHR